MPALESVESHLKEARLYPPPAEFARHARLASAAEYEALRERALRDPEQFWAEVAQELHWFRRWERVLEWRPPEARWFAGGQLNASFNCLDRQIQAGLGDKPAILFEGEPGDVRRISFRELHAEVCRLAGALRSLGVRKGDRVTIYMPMVPELLVAVLACARIGAPHSVVFGGFSVQALLDRVRDSGSRVVITADGGHRRGQVVPLKRTVDEMCQRTDLVEHVIVYRRCGNPVDMQPGRDQWWHECLARAAPLEQAEPCDAEDMLFLLYTSGTTGKPKGVVHTTGGYLVQTAYTAKMVFDLQPDDVFWCTDDVGTMTGHSYVVYGILAHGVTTLMYEGAPNYPDWERWWQICQRHRVTQFYTVPTAIRAAMRQGRALVDRYDLSSLRLLGTAGEPINPQAWLWYHEVVGRGRCPIVDTWWQVETGSILITPLPGVTPTKPGSVGRPFFGVDAVVVDAAGRPQPPNAGGLLCIRRPWPSMLRGIFGDPQRYRNQYWLDSQGSYFAGDSARCDEDGYFWIMGRVDDVIKVSGHRLGTMEIESALVSHAAVAEAAVVGIPHELKGSAIAAFVTLVSDRQPSPELAEELREHVANQLSPVARPDQIHFAQALPRTRSGKIVRRLLRDIASGAAPGDAQLLEDAGVLEQLGRG